MLNLPKKVTIIEVGARDSLQNEKLFAPTVCLNEWGFIPVLTLIGSLTLLKSFGPMHQDKLIAGIIGFIPNLFRLSYE